MSIKQGSFLTKFIVDGINLSKEDLTVEDIKSGEDTFVAMVRDL